MSRIAIAAALVLATTVSAFAQPMAADKPAKGAMGDMNAMSCQQMMDKGKMSMGSMADGAQKTMMMGEMDMAKKSMAMKNEADCKMHMQKAMGGGM